MTIESQSWGQEEDVFFVNGRVSPKNNSQRIRLAAVLGFYNCQPTTEAD
jgi:hypothetical protein